MRRAEICTVVRDGVMRLGATSCVRKFGARTCAAHADRVCNHWCGTFEAVHPLALGLGPGWALGYGPRGAGDTRGVLELMSYVGHACQEYPVSPELATLYFPIPGTFPACPKRVSCIIYPFPV